MWLTNIQIWDGVSDSLSPADAILIEQQKIVRLGASDEAKGTVVDLQGMTLIPGLIDAHVHMCLNPDIKDPLAQDKLSDEDIIQQIITRTEQMLAAGITTARDLGGGAWLELKVRDLINQGKVKGTRLICAGQPVTSVQGHCHFWGGESKDVAAGKAVIERQIEKGVDLIKIMATGGSLTPGSTPANAQFDAEQMTQLVELAKSYQYRVAAHCHGTVGIKNAAEAGVTTIEHCSWVGDNGWGRDYDADVATSVVEKGVWVSPTINAGWQRYIGTKNFESMIQGNYEKMRAAGIKLIASTDAGIPNVWHHDLPKAIPVFAHFAGLSNVEALRAATSDCAEAIGLGEQVGRLAANFDADIVCFDGNPLEDLSLLANPTRVMARGAFVE